MHLINNVFCQRKGNELPSIYPVCTNLYKLHDQNCRHQISFCSVLQMVQDHPALYKIICIYLTFRLAPVKNKSKTEIMYIAEDRKLVHLMILQFKRNLTCTV